MLQQNPSNLARSYAAAEALRRDWLRNHTRGPDMYHLWGTNQRAGDASRCQANKIKKIAETSREIHGSQIVFPAAAKAAEIIAISLSQRRGNGSRRAVFTSSRNAYSAMDRRCLGPAPIPYTETDSERI